MQNVEYEPVSSFDSLISCKKNFEIHNQKIPYYVMTNNAQFLKKIKHNVVINNSENFSINF